MADAAITFDALEALEVHAQFAAQVAFDDILAVLNRVDALGKLLFSQILRPDGGINVRALQNFFGIDGAYAIDVAQRDVDSLVGRNFHSDNTCHKI